ncbi:MAG: DNA/RNA non-specific endonuclease [Pseudohongiellaceae bacterium]
MEIVSVVKGAGSGKALALLFGSLCFICLAARSAVYAEEVRIASCLAGCPSGTPADNDVVARPIYALSFNHSNALADWVAYRVTAGSIGIATNLSREPIEDPYLSDTLKPADYAGAEQMGLVASYFVPMVSFARTPYWRDVNYLSNFVPRNSELNRGSWYGLEWAVRNLASRAGEVYVTTGPIYDLESDSVTPLPRLPIDKPHRVPAAFYKIIAGSDGRISAFLFDQNVEFYVHHCEHRTAVTTVEQLTGLDFFPEERQWPTGTLDAEIGCP